MPMLDTSAELSTIAGFRRRLATRRDIAYKALGVTATQAAAVPQITPQLLAIAKTIRRAGQPGPRQGQPRPATTQPVPYGPGADVEQSWPYYLQASDHPDAKKVLDAYYTIPTKQLSQALPIEAYCVAANVPTMTILEVLTGVIVRLGVNAAIIIAAVNQPRVVQKSVDMALTDEGFEDRQLLARHTGFLPTAKGPSTSVIVHASSSANAQAAAAVPAPAPENTIRRLVNKFNARKSLGGVAPASLPERASTEQLPDLQATAAEPIEAELMDADEAD